MLHKTRFQYARYFSMNLRSSSVQTNIQGGYNIPNAFLTCRKYHVGLVSDSCSTSNSKSLMASQYK